jgi:alpha-mannosidase
MTNGPRTRLCVALAALLLTVQTVSAADQAATPQPLKDKPTFWVIPHTHWEGAVFKTREQYLEMGLAHILQALRLLKTQPDYRFVLDQVAYVRPFLDRYPEEKPAFKKFVTEGRLQIVLGMDVMPDVNMPGGESMLRQVEYGKGYLKHALGVEPTAAWLVDTFGHHPQMPQLLKHAGYETFWCSRGVENADHPTDYLWEGLDGTRIRSFYLPFSYALLYMSPRDPANFNNFVRQKWDAINANSTPGADRLGAAGADVTPPEDMVAPMVKAFNEQFAKDAPFTMKVGTPGDFENAVAGRKDLPVDKTDFNPIFQGTYSSRIDLKHWMRTMESKLTTAEKLAAVGATFGKHAISDGQLWRAWEPVLFNETHDIASGVMTDHVYADTIRTFEFSNQLADEMIDTGLKVLMERIDTRAGETKGAVVPVVVFNSLGWARNDVAEVTVGFGASDGTKDVGIVDADGKAVPAQIVREQRYPDGTLCEATLAFVARNVPAMGYAVFEVVTKPELPAKPATAAAGDTATLENESYRLTFDKLTGAMTSLRVKDGDWEVLSGQTGNVVSRQEDKGDLWELYQGLNGGQNVKMTRKQPPPKAGDPGVKLSSEFKSKESAKVMVGPVFSEFEVAHPFDTGNVSTRVRVYNGLPRIDVRTKLVNNEKLVRYQVQFPTTIKSGKAVRAIPFGAAEQPDGVEYPAQEWTDYSDSARGLAVLNSGQPGNVVSDGTMMLSLHRAHNLGAYGFGGGLEPGMSSESGMQLGKPITLHYALRPHAGTWQDAGVYRDGMEFNRPLIVRKAQRHPGTLPKRWGMLEVSKPNVVLSSLKPGRDGSLVFRVYEAAGTATPGVSVKFASAVKSAEQVNALEAPQGPVASAGDAVSFDLRSFEIKAVRVRLAEMAPAQEKR